MSRLLRLFAIVTLALGLAGMARADQSRVYVQGGVALGGYDVVIYFTENRAVVGSADHAVMWKGATWYFVSPETMSSFEMNPRAYAPQYGGYCAWAMAQGRIAASSPEAFMIVNGKLYLNDGPVVRDNWAAGMEANIAAANAHWKAFLGK